MDRIGIRELRQNASRYISRVKGGESIEVTDRGTPVAVLGPLSEATQPRFERLVQEGVIVPSRGDLVTWLADNPPLPADPDYRGPTTTEILLQMREDEQY